MAHSQRIRMKENENYRYEVGLDKNKYLLFSHKSPSFGHWQFEL